jgi:hypothetical protein
MDYRPPVSLKPLADQLADLLAPGKKTKEEKAHDEQIIKKLKSKLGLIDEQRGKEMNIDSSGSIPGDSGKVGIWTPTIIDGKKSFVHNQNHKDDFILWANVEHISPKSRKKRVVFIGESVARGFLYDPFFTPSSYLGELLNPELEPDGAEVIDLAKTNCSYHGLIELCTESLNLEPDAAVIFAGNNWINVNLFSVEERYHIIEMMRQEANFDKFQSIIEERYRKLVSNLVKHAVSVFHDNKIPLVIIIPEFNLMDWKCNDLDHLLAWPGEEITKWVEMKENARQAITSGEIDKAELLLTEMIRFNRSNPLAYYWMAECKLKKQLLSEARDYFILANDSKMLRFINIPGICSVLQKAIRDECERFQVPVVDLPGEFQKNGIPGKELFIDYCHHTAEGIQTSMALTANKLVLLLKEKDVPLERLRSYGNNPSNSVKAWAHFFAAIHNAHKGQPYEILYHHCLEALHLDISLVKFFLHYIIMANGDVPWSLSAACEALTDSGQISQYLTLIQPDLFAMMDVPLVNAMIEALKTQDIDIRDKIDDLMIRNHGVNNGKINLLESYYHLNSHTYLSIFSEGFYRAYDTGSCFYLVTEANTDVEFKLTCRVPYLKSHEGMIAIKLNGVLLFRFPVSRKWNTHQFRIPGAHTRKGVNHLVMQWPLDLRFNNNSGESYDTFQFKKNSSDYQMRIIYPIYGEIHTFTAAPPITTT